MSNDLISVPRELLEKLFSSKQVDYSYWVTLDKLRDLLAKPNTFTKDGEVEVLGYSVKGNRYAIRLTKAELLELHEGYTGEALIELVDRRHVTRLQAAQVPVVQKYDDTLLPFFTLMRKELHANAGKGDRPGWLQMSADTCLLEIIYHFGKLQKAVKKGDVEGMNEYAADVANMCMMLLDICGALSMVDASACLDEFKRLNPELFK